MVLRLVRYLVGPLSASLLWTLGCASDDATIPPKPAPPSADSGNAKEGGSAKDATLDSMLDAASDASDATLDVDAAGSCPVVAVAVADVSNGNSFSVSGSASGASDAGGFTYAWSAPSGSFDTPTAATANFTCRSPGPVLLTLTVGDASVTDGGSCTPAIGSVQVTCGHVDAAAALKTATKIKHLVVIFNENVSFDHYYATYPMALNLAGEPEFHAAPDTPSLNNLVTPLDPTHGFAPIVDAGGDAGLLTSNPNLENHANGANASNPFRLAPLQAITQDENHNYKPEQQADDDGGMDLFPLFTGVAGPPPSSPAGAATAGLVMAYYDGNTTNALWGYAQKYALNDNAWTTTFGPSTVGAINLISGQTNGFAATNKSPTLMSTSHVVADEHGGYTLIGDMDPLGDVCSTSSDQVTMAGTNIGDLLNAEKVPVSWGWFQGGFDLLVTDANGTTGCNRLTVQTVPNPAYSSNDYVPHHAPFQYYPSTANPMHARPSSLSAIGSSLEADGKTAEPANHQYDTLDFFDALSGGNLPAVVFLKAPAFEDAHPGNSDPIDEQNFVVSVVDALQAAQEWSTTAIVLTYDDSDGWYDHQLPPIVNPSSSAADALNGPGACHTGAQQDGGAPTTPLLGAPLADGGVYPAEGRCGHGTRVPFQVISPFAKNNFVDHTLLDQTSVIRFIEDNWLGGKRVQPGGSFDAMAHSFENMLTGI
jgi:phospholipase C